MCDTTKDHCVQVPWKYIKVCGYSDFFQNLEPKIIDPKMTFDLMWPCLLRSHVWLYPRIIVSKSHGNTSMYVETVINFAKYRILHKDYILHTYYVQNEWSHSLFLNTFQARQKLLRNVKSVFLTNFFHKIVRRNVTLTREILNLDSKIKHLSPVYKKRDWKAAQTTAKLVSSPVVITWC